MQIVMGDKRLTRYRKMSRACISLFNTGTMIDRTFDLVLMINKCN